MPRVRYDDRMLEYCRGNAEKTIDIIDRVLNNQSSLGRAAYEAGFDAIGFRKVLAVLESAADGHPRETPADTAIYRTAEEMFYGDVFGISVDDDEIWETIPQDSDKVMQWIYGGADGKLSEREAKILRMRYDESMTLEDVGKEFGVTRDRIRQIQSRAIRKMRSPKMARILRCGMLYYDEVQREFERQKEEILRGLVDEKLRMDAEIKSAEEALENPKEKLDAYNGLINMDIEELGFSVRSYSCLKRSGYDKVKDLMEIPDIYAMWRIRNLGRKSSEEIVSKLKKLGIKCPITGEKEE